MRRYWALLVLLAVAILGGVSSSPPTAFSTPDYPLATKGPPANWNVTASWPDKTLRELCLQATSVVWVDVTGVEERWTWNDVEWSKYSAQVREYIVNRTGSSPDAVSIVQLGGGKEIYFEYPHLQPGRSYVLVLVSREAGGRFNPNYLAHPVAIYPVVGDGVVETWWPMPWTRSNPFLQVRELREQVRSAADTGG